MPVAREEMERMREVYGRVHSSPTPQQALILELLGITPGSSAFFVAEKLLEKSWNKASDSHDKVLTISEESICSVLPEGSPTPRSQEVAAAILQHLATTSQNNEMGIAGILENGLHISASEPSIYKFRIESYKARLLEHVRTSLTAARSLVG